MKKTKIFLIDYVGQSNDQSEPVGHSVKTLEETRELLESLADVRFVIPQNYRKKFLKYSGEHLFFLKYHSSITLKSIYNRCRGFLGKMKNLRRVLKKGTFPPGYEEAIWWFIHPDFLLFVFLFFYPFKIKNIIWVTLYMAGFNRGNTVRERIKNFFFGRTLHKIDLVIKNSDKMNVCERELFCPDYLYKADRYLPYSSKKKDVILSAGVMNRGKDLLHLVTAWSRFNSKYKLKITGFFPDKTFFEEIKQFENEKIEIIDNYLNRETYYRSLAEAAFVILSYKKTGYGDRTSGILLESIFLDTPVIAPRFLLDYTGMPGISYEKIDDVEILLEETDENSLQEIKKRMKQVREDYEFSGMKKKMAVAIASLVQKK